MSESMKKHELAITEAVGKLFAIVYRSKWNTLLLDTDEDMPNVFLWIPFHRRTIEVRGTRRYGMIEDGTVIYPTEDGESWCFLECCQRALDEVEKLDNA